MTPNQANTNPDREAEARPNDDGRRGDTLRYIGAGFGSLGGACILFLSAMANALPDMAQRVAIGGFAIALPLLLFAAVASYSLSLLAGADGRTTSVRRAIGATIAFGLLGALGVGAGLAAMLWQLWPLASISFVGCALVALVVYSSFTHLVQPRRAST